jgi:hypothetical protein
MAGNDLVDAAKRVEGLTMAPLRFMVDAATKARDFLGGDQKPKLQTPPNGWPQNEVRQTPTGAIQKKAFPR